MAARNLRSADDLLLPALRQTIKALDPPESDAALVRLAERLAAAIDAMPPAVQAAMIAQVSGQYQKTLAELEKRAAVRRRPSARPRSRLDELREAWGHADVARQSGRRLGATRARCTT